VDAAGEVVGSVTGVDVHAANAAAMNAMMRRSTRCGMRGREMGDGLWIIVLEMVLVLALGAFIVWWTLGGRRKEPGRDEGTRTDRGE